MTSRLERIAADMFNSEQRRGWIANGRSVALGIVSAMVGGDDLTSFQHIRGAIQLTLLVAAHFIADQFVL